MNALLGCGWACKGDLSQSFLINPTLSDLLETGLGWGSHWLFIYFPLGPPGLLPLLIHSPCFPSLSPVHLLLTGALRQLSTIIRFKHLSLSSCDSVHFGNGVWLRSSWQSMGWPVPEEFRVRSPAVNPAGIVDRPKFSQLYLELLKRIQVGFWTFCSLGTHCASAGHLNLDIFFSSMHLLSLAKGNFF